MKSCRHKRHRHLILNWFRAGGVISSGVDEEPHIIRLSDEDRMVKILGGVL